MYVVNVGSLSRLPLQRARKQNAEDSLVLEPLLYLAYEKEKARHPELRVPELPPAQPLPPLKTEVCEFVYKLLRGEETWQAPEGW